VLSRAAEDAIRNAIKSTGVGKMLALPEDASRAMLSQLRQALADGGDQQTAVLLTSLDIRRVMRNYLLRNDIELPVISYQEIAPEYSVQSLMSVTINSQIRNRSTKSESNEAESAQEKHALTFG